MCERYERRAEHDDKARIEFESWWKTCHADKDNPAPPPMIDLGDAEAFQSHLWLEANPHLTRAHAVLRHRLYGEPLPEIVDDADLLLAQMQASIAGGW